MKRLGIILIVFALAFMSCDGEETISQKERRLAKEKRKSKTELVKTPIVIETSAKIAQVEETIEKVVHVTYTTIPTDSSYWYVIMSDDVAMWHGTVKLATPYFHFIEAKKQFKKSEGDGYFKFILQINKESLSSYKNMND